MRGPRLAATARHAHDVVLVAVELCYVTATRGVMEPVHVLVSRRARVGPTRRAMAALVATLPPPAVASSVPCRRPRGILV